ncbi:MAG TPA: TIGR03086 family metal-binding protein [Chloroflexota bacterium]|nr:TIGR03086 family metal-binding protein [Chloroflexota bacterium]
MTPTTANPGDLYVRAMASTQRYMDGVGDDQWHAPTPCSEWDVAQIANHLIGENLWAAELLRGKTIEQVGNRLDGDLTGNQPARAYRDSVAAASAAATASGSMEVICHLSFGDFSGADYCSQLFMDLLIHGWDVAKATGQDTKLDPRLVGACLPIAQQLTSQWRSAGVFGEDLPVAADADAQTKLLALFGRGA